MGVTETDEPPPPEARAAGARALAERAHQGQIEPSGRPYIEHVRRVASAVPPFARGVAWLHDALEWTELGESELEAAGLDPDELAAIRLLTRGVDDHGDPGFLEHVSAVARAPGRPGQIARTVKRADMDDRARHPRDPAGGWMPPYERARHLLAALTGTSGRHLARGAPHTPGGAPAW